MDKDNDKDRSDKLGAAGADPASLLDAATLFGRWLASPTQSPEILAYAT